MGVRSGVRTQVLSGGLGIVVRAYSSFYVFGGYLGAYIYVAILDQVAKLYKQLSHFAQSSGSS